jgi:hypothetical protein
MNSIQMNLVLYLFLMVYFNIISSPNIKLELQI